METLPGNLAAWALGHNAMEKTVVLTGSYVSSRDLRAQSQVECVRKNL